MTDDPVLDAARHTEALDSEAERRERNVESLAALFLAAAHEGDMRATAFFGTRSRLDSPYTGARRRETVAEVIDDAADYRDFRAELLTLFCQAAQGQHIQTRAQDLLARMARNWADLQVEG